MNAMTYEELKAVCEAQVKEDKNFLAAVMNSSGISYIEGKHEFMFIRMEDKVLSKKNKIVKSSYAICENSDDGLHFNAVISIEANADNLNANQIKFSNCGNMKFRKPTNEDAFAFQIANKFFLTFPNFNNLFGMAFNVRDTKGKLVKKNIGMKGLSHYCGY